MMTDKIAVLIQARMSSSRLPGKVLLRAVSKPVQTFLEYQISRLSQLDENIIIDSKTIAEQFIESDILNLQNINTNTIVNTASTNASGSYLDKVIYFTLTLIVFIIMWARFNN